MAKKKTVKKRAAKKSARKVARKSARGIGKKSSAAKKKAARKTSAKKGSPRGVKRAVASAAIGEELKAICRGLPGTTEDVKWGDDLVFSVGGKMYAAFDLDDSEELAFKCDDEDFERLVEVDGVIPAPYAAKLGWVKVQRSSALPADELRWLLAKAHGIVMSGLPKRKQEALRAGTA